MRPPQSGEPSPQDDFDDHFELLEDDGRTLDEFEEYWEALLPDDDYEPQPEFGDFWTDQDAA